MCEYISMEVLEISIHVPTRGTTPSTVLNYTVDRFQSTCPRGARLRVTGKSFKVIFQSTCPRGARPQFAVVIFAVPLFQSTCPRGARLSNNFEILDTNLFQSTCPRGARLHVAVLGDALVISIHVPTRGTTQRYGSKQKH